MACACRNRKKTKYVWTSEDGGTTVEYDHEVIAKAKVSRVGGAYQTVVKQ